MEQSADVGGGRSQLVPSASVAEHREFFRTLGKHRSRREAMARLLVLLESGAGGGDSEIPVRCSSRRAR